MPGGTGERELKLKVTTEGLTEAAAGQERLAQGQERAAKATGGPVDADSLRDTADATTEVADANAEASASSSDWAMMLSLLSPQLGAATTAGQAAAKMAASLGQINLTTGDAVAKLTTHVKANADGYAALIAGGALVAGILAIAKAFQEVEKAAQAAKKATDDFKNAQTTLAERAAEVRKQLADKLSDLGAATPETLQRAEKLAKFARQQGFGESGLEAAAAVAAAGGSREQTLALAAASERGLIEPGEERALEKLQALQRQPDKQQAIAEQTRFRQALDSFSALAERAKAQVESFAVTREIGEHTVQDYGPMNAILQYLEQVEGLTGGQASERIKYMQQVKARQDARAAGQSEPFGLFHATPAELWARKAGGAFELAEMSLAGLEQAARSSPREPQVINITHHHIGTRVYRNRNGIRGGRPNRRRRDLSGRD